MMSVSRGLVLGLILIAADLYSINGQREYREECRIWDNVTRMLSSERNVQMDCSTNQQCTGYDCDGKYTYNGIYDAYTTMTMMFCFGIAIHPCTYPTDMSFYVELYNGNVTDSYQAVVTQNDTVQIPGAHYALGSVYSADAFVTVTMQNRTIQGRPYLKLGLSLKIAVSTPFGTIWPDDMQRTLMPDTTIPVPPCDSSVRTPSHVPHTCTKYVPPTTPSGATPTTTTTPIPGNDTARSCKVGAMYPCKNYETCNADTKTCVCWPEYMRTKSGCVPITPTEIIFIEDYSVKTSNTTIIIVGSVVSIMVVLGAIVGIVVWRYKRFHDRYGGHQMLMTSDDDEPLDVAA